MQAQTVSFSTSSTTFYFDAAFANLGKIVKQQASVVITDATIFAAHQEKFEGWKTIVIKAGERYKDQATVDGIIAQLIEYGADRATRLIGVGGGVVTDITGYVASVYLRGIPFGFVPTTVLAMVDAAVGGKNGIDVGVYKNMVGTITQPQFLLYDMGFLKTLPDGEWRNGFAEIIKHAAIKKAGLFQELQNASLKHYQENTSALQQLIQENVMLKAGIVQQDEREIGERRLLNFGHTLAHALEKKYELMHGEAVAIGMVFAAKLSAALWGFEKVEVLRSVIEKYGLPTKIPYDKEAVFNVLKRDKKKEGDMVHFILLHEIGKAGVERLSLTDVLNYL
jgi:3-dehydroquinate synthase